MRQNYIPVQELKLIKNAEEAYLREGRGVIAGFYGIPIQDYTTVNFRCKNIFVVDGGYEN